MMLKGLEHFFYMGGFALYVWLAYGCGFIIVTANIVWPILHKRRLRKQLKRYIRQRDESGS